MPEHNQAHSSPNPEHPNSDALPQDYEGWVGLIADITGGEVVDGAHDVISTNEPLVKKVQVPGGLQSNFGRTASVRIVGDREVGYTVRVRGRWPTTTQTSYFIVPRQADGVLVASETTGSKTFLFRPKKYEDDFTPAPKDQSVKHLNPELDDEDKRLFVELLANTAAQSERLGLNQPSDI